jgi:ectoine hydroxylase-related dioxygenase (phytanoyl-CoA dioxygenase family)
MAEIRHLPPTASVNEVTACLSEDGFVIIDRLASDALMDRVSEQMQPYVDATPFGQDDFAGKLTRRTGSMIARSPAARELVMNETILGTARSFLSHASTFQLHLTQVITLEPGSAAQVIHRDQLAWDFFPFPADYEVQCNTLWALSDYDEAVGATRVVPGSHRLPDGQKFTQDQSVAAEMERGSVLLYSGKIYHGGGANVTADRVRQAINITYAVGWVRQEENQYISTPPEIATTLDDDILRLMGYQVGAIALGYMRDFEDPLVAVRGAKAGALPMNLTTMTTNADKPKAAREFFANIGETL